MFYLAAGVFWLTDNGMDLVRLGWDRSGDVAMSFLDSSKASVEKFKIAALY